MKDLSSTVSKDYLSAKIEDKYKISKYQYLHNRDFRVSTKLNI